jgi:hypothetical protein
MTESHEREAMTLPGFNAEASAFKTSAHYHSMGASVQTGGVVLQQFPPPGSCFARCARACRSNPWFHACYQECVFDNCE